MYSLCSVSTHDSALYTGKAQSTMTYKHVSTAEVQMMKIQRDWRRLHLVSQTKSNFCLVRSSTWGGLVNRFCGCIKSTGYHIPKWHSIHSSVGCSPKISLLYPINLKHHWFLDKCNASQIMFATNIMFRFNETFTAIFNYPNL